MNDRRYGSSANLPGDSPSDAPTMTTPEDIALELDPTQLCAYCGRWTWVCQCDEWAIPQEADPLMDFAITQPSYGGYSRPTRYP